MSLSGRESDVSPHFGLIPAALIIGHHFRNFRFCSAPSACGVCCSRTRMTDALARELPPTSQHSTHVDSGSISPYV